MRRKSWQQRTKAAFYVRAGKSYENCEGISPAHKHIETLSPCAIHAHFPLVYRYARFIQCFQNFFNVVGILTFPNGYVFFDECAIASCHLRRIISPLNVTEIFFTLAENIISRTYTLSYSTIHMCVFICFRHVRLVAGRNRLSQDKFH